MSIPGYLILITFTLVFLGLVVMAVVHIFHAWRFGEHTPLAAITSGIFFFGIVAIVGLAVYFLQDVDWSQSFSVELPFISTSPSSKIMPQ